MPKPTAHELLGAWLAALAAAVGSFFAIAVAVIELGVVWAKLRYPGDLSGGDSVGWGLVFLAPILVPLDLAVSLAVGAVVFSKVLPRR